MIRAEMDMGLSLSTGRANRFNLLGYNTRASLCVVRHARSGASTEGAMGLAANQPK